jgi:hypothetical protein
MTPQQQRFTGPSWRVRIEFDDGFVHEATVFSRTERAALDLGLSEARMGFGDYRRQVVSKTAVQK